MTPIGDFTGPFGVPERDGGMSADDAKALNILYCAGSKYHTTLYV